MILTLNSPDLGAAARQTRIGRLLWAAVLVATVLVATALAAGCKSPNGEGAQDEWPASGGFGQPRLLYVGDEPGRAPDFRLRNQDDRFVQLSDYRGSYVHLDFAAIWCGPCRIQARYLRSLEDELEPHGFVSMTVMVTRDPLDAQRWARRYRLRNVLGDYEGQARQKFRAYRFPTNVIIRPDGTIAARWAGAPPTRVSFRRQLKRVVPELFRRPPNNNAEPRPTDRLSEDRHSLSI